nr:hypothetical protein [Tanacetum cinerariifolium]
DIDSLTRTMNYHPVIAENQTNSHADLQDTKKAGDEGTHTYVLFSVLSDDFIYSQNNNKDALVDGKEHDDDIQKSVSPDIHSSSSGAQTRKQCDKTENKDKGKSHIVTIIGFKDLNADAAGPSNAAASPTAVNSSLQDASTSTHDSDMPNLEDLTPSDDADDVGAEADIYNLESIISVSPIPTTRIHKDHPTSQIIGDLSSTAQTRSMARTVRDQGERKPRKGQNRIKTRQKREACRSREKFKAVTVDKGRKTEENAKRMVENAYTVKKLFKYLKNEERKGPFLQVLQSSNTRTNSAYLFKVVVPGTSHEIGHITMWDCSC